MNTPRTKEARERCTFLTIARKLPSRERQPSGIAGAEPSNISELLAGRPRMQRTHRYFDATRRGGKLNNVRRDGRSRKKGNATKRGKENARAKRRESKSVYPTIGASAFPFGAPRRYPSLTYGQVSSESVWRAGYHYVYSLELKCHIMTQLGGPYNLCP